MSFIFKSKSVNEIKKNLGIDKKGKLQIYIDKRFSENLGPYVSRDEGVQEESIKLATVLGSGNVIINVPYATYQAYSSKIKKRDGKRGTRPFERMCADKKDSMLKEFAEYARRLDNGR